MFETLLVYASALLLGWPLGLYMARVMSGQRTWCEGVFGCLEKPLYALLGRQQLAPMRLAHYLSAFVISNAVLGSVAFLVFSFQADLPLNPNGVSNMSWDLALHTAISFLTNTNQQHYSGQAQLSYLAQMTAVVGLQFITPIMGLAMVVATLRALCPADADATSAGQVRVVGNFWVDLIRPAVRVFLPLSIVVGLVLASQGVPATLEGGPVAQTLDSSAQVNTQKIPLGPVAPMVAIKQLGTNGGGWYGPNSAVALENPTPLSNLVETLSLILLPVAVVFMVSPLTGRRRFTALVLGVMLSMSLVSTLASSLAEGISSSLPAGSLMEGKEQRFTPQATALWSSLTTQTSNGSVNGMHDSLAPLTGLVAMANMLINSIWGGIGCGLAQFLVYLLLAVFLSGLMTGRTPELFGRKIEATEVRWLGLLVLLQPIAVLGFTAVAMAVPEWTGNSNPSFHGLSQVFYEYTSAFANNGSGFEGLGDATVWWNLSASAVLLLGRYPALMLPLVIAASLAAKRPSPEGDGALRVESLTMGLTLIAIIVILTLLQFMPVLVLGPVAEHFSLIQ